MPKKPQFQDNTKHYRRTVGKSKAQQLADEMKEAMNKKFPEPQSVEEILKKFDDDNYAFWADNTDKTMNLEQWNKGKAKLRTQTLTAIKKLMLDIVGEDEPEMVGNTHKNGAAVRNQLRELQRRKAGLV